MTRNRTKTIILVSLISTAILVSIVSLRLVSAHRLNLISALFLIALMFSFIIKISPRVFLTMAAILIIILPLFIGQIIGNNLASYIFYLISLYLANSFLRRSKLANYRLDYKNLKKNLFNCFKNTLPTPNLQLAVIALIWLIISLLLKAFTTISLGTILFLTMLLLLLFIKLSARLLFFTTLILLLAAIALKLLGINLLAQKMVIVSYLNTLAAIWLALKNQVLQKIKLPKFDLIKTKNLTLFSLLCLGFISLMLFVPFLTTEGLLENGDLVTTLNNNYYDRQYFFYLWQDNGSFSRLAGSSTAQFWSYLPFALIKSIANLSISAISKLALIIPFWLGLFSAYFLAKKILSQEKIKDAANSTSIIEALSIIGAMFFAFNPWALARMVHLSHYYSYSLLPLALLALNRLFSKPSLTILLLTAILINLVAWSPHFLIYLCLIIIIYCLCYYKNFNLIIKNILRLALITIFVASFWLWPYFKISQNQGQFLEPGYIVRQADIKPAGLNFVQYLSLNSRSPINPQVTWAWRYFIAFLALSLPITFIFSRQNKLIKTIALTGGLVSTFYLLIIKYPVLYFWLIFDSPVASFGWLWREPYRLAGLLAFSYSFSFIFVLYKLVKHWQRRNYILIFSVLLLILIISLI